MKRPLFLILTFLALGLSGVALARIAPSIGGGNGSASGTGNWPPSGTPADLLDGDQTGGSGASGIVTSTIAVYQATLFHSFQTGGSTKAVIANNGNVGIGTTNPATALDVNGTVTATTLDGNIAASKVQSGSLGTSVMASSVAAQKVNAGSLLSTDNPASGEVPSYDPTTGGVTWVAQSAGSGGSDNFGTHTASKVIDAAGFAVTRVSSIVFNTGSSPIVAGMVSSAAVNTISVAQHFNAISPGTGKVLSMAADNTLAWATDQSAAGGGDQMGAHVATMPVVSAFAATFSSITSNGPISVGGGPAIIDSTQTVLQVRVTDTSDVDFEVAETSVSVGGVRVSTDQANTVGTLANKTIDAAINVISFRDQDRFTTPSFASGTFVTYIATPTMGISSSTIGHFQFSNAISSQANFAVYAWIPPSDIDLTANVILSSFGVILGGADTGTQRYMVAISTSMDGRPARETMFSSPYSWLESITVDVGADSAGINGYLQVVGNTTLTSWQTRIIPGALHYITVMRDGDAAQDSSTIDSYSSFFSISYKRRLTQ